MAYSYDRQASSGEPLADRLRAFFEETATALQQELRAGSPKRRVEEKKLGVIYTIEVIVDPVLGMYDRKVTLQIDGGVVLFSIEAGSEERPGQFALRKVGTGSASISVTPKGLAEVIGRAAVSSSLY